MLVERLSHRDEGWAVVSSVRMFGGLDEPQGCESLMVLRQFDACIQFHGRVAGVSGKVLCGLHETAAYALALPVWPDGEFPNIQ